MKTACLEKIWIDRHVDRHELKEQGWLTGILKKLSRQVGHFGPKMAQPPNSGSAVVIFKKFCTMKGANR